MEGFVDAVHLFAADTPDIAHHPAFVDGFDLLQKDNRSAVHALHGGKQIVCGLMRFLASAGCQRSYNESRAIEVAGVVLQQKNRACATLFRADIGI